ncbi:MAG: NAD(P)H-dependent oxidoreductase [Acidimicrobiia bacterium]
MLLPVLKARHARGEILKIGVVGAGQMGEGLIAQMETMYGMRAFVVADAVPGRALASLRSAGVADSDIVETDDPDVATAATDSGKRVASTNPATTWVGPVDVTVEATGIPEVGARVAYEAILARKHVLQMNVETDATIGWLLRRMANAAGVVYTLTAGDEPGSTMELYDFAVSLGFEVVCAGKGKNNPLDRSGNPDTVAEQAAAQQMNPKMLASFVDGTKTMVEMTSFANAAGFIPDIPGMHGPEVTPKNLADVYIPAEDGGILSARGRVEYGRGIAPGVFVVFTTEHPKLVRDLQYLSMGKGPYWALYRPYHLTSLETPISIARAAIQGDTTVATDNQPTAETVTYAKRALQAGETVDGLGGFSVYGMIETAAEASRQRLLPLGLAPGAVLRRDVELGQPVSYDDVDLDQSLMIVHLRKLQDLDLK